MFDAMVHGKIDTGDISYEVHLADILHLNQMVIKGELDMVKISYNTYGQVLNQYQLLSAGSALGHDCGPLLISHKKLSVEEVVEKELPIAIPGKNTTANLLLGYYAPEIRNKKEYIFHEIMPAILSGEVAAGVIIHENRFTYQEAGLQLIQDLGAYWESTTELPIPLGAIVARKTLGESVIRKLQNHMRESVAYAFSNPNESKAFVRKHAQEMNENVMKAHIQLYVNDYSLDLGEKGNRAVRKLLETGNKMGLYTKGIQ
ncbi:UNVERIFIED_CONTAM: hypothetical protein GTU68_016468 [Idotea baltica]|nr:hypothetical protein [Idotea baltica]